MTRTSHKTFPRAVIKDRSVSRNGGDKQLKKGGYGGWGTIKSHEEDDVELDFDETFEEDSDAFEVANLTSKNSAAEDSGSVSSSVEDGTIIKPALKHRSSSISQSEFDSAKEIRGSSFKSNNIDLASIARSSIAVASTSPSDSFGGSSIGSVEWTGNRVRANSYGSK